MRRTLQPRVGIAARPGLEQTGVSIMVARAGESARKLDYAFVSYEQTTAVTLSAVPLLAGPEEEGWQDR